MRLMRVVTGKRWAILIVCLLLLASVPIIHKTRATDENVDVIEPSQLYISRPQEDDNATTEVVGIDPSSGEPVPLPMTRHDVFMRVWNATKELDEMSELSSYGEYSVLICPDAYWEGGPNTFFVVVSNLQPNQEGLVHQLVVRFEWFFGHHAHACSDCRWMHPDFVKSYSEACSYNRVSVEDGKKILEEFITQELLFPIVISSGQYQVDYPFLTLLDASCANNSSTRATMVLNLCTGQIMSAWTIVDEDPFSHYLSVHLLHPYGVPADFLRFTSIDFQVGEAGNGSILVIMKNEWRALESPVTINEVYVNDAKQNSTNPPLPTTILPKGELVLNISVNVAFGSDYKVRLVSSQDIFLVEACSPSAPSPRVLYIADFNFYISGGKKIDIDIGNTWGDTQIMQLYVGTSPSTLQNQNITPANLTTGDDNSARAARRVTVKYNWIDGATCYFRAVFSNGQSIDWSGQAPPPRARPPKDNAPVVRIEPENVTVREGDVFNLSVLIENVPVNPGLAGVQFSLTWDPSVLEVVNMTEVMFHEATPVCEWDNIWKLKHMINNTAGFLSYGYLWQDMSRALDGGYAPIWGNQTLATITMKGVAAGSTMVYFLTVKLGTPEANPIDRALIDGNVNVVRATIDSGVNVEKTREPDTPDTKIYVQNSTEKTNEGSHPEPTSTVTQDQNIPQVLDVAAPLFGVAAGTALITVSASSLARPRSARAMLSKKRTRASQILEKCCWGRDNE
jgi:hypothetical protein